MSRKLSKESKLEVIDRIKAGENIANLSRELNVSRTIIYKWLKKYQSASARAKQKVLEAHHPKGSSHWRSISPNTEQKIIKISLKNPDFSPQKIAQQVGEVSGHGVWRVLKRHGLNTLQNRTSYIYRNGSSLIKTVSHENRIIMIRRFEAGESISKICQDFNISRTFFYRLLKRYQSAPSETKNNSLADLRPKGPNHWRFIQGEYEEAVLAAVREYPELSSQKLVWVLPQVGGTPIVSTHGVHNVLTRHNLSTYQQRLAYSEAYHKPTASTRFFGIFQKALDFVGSRQPLQRKLYVGGAFGSVAIIFGLVVILGSVGLFRLIFEAPSIAFSLGVIFSLIAFALGMFFFFYSLKYYLTVAIVLSFSRYQSDKEIDFSQSFLGKFFNSITEKSKEHLGKGLRPDLSKVELNRKPFISIHLATYNEKRVIDRLLTAATTQEYENYEVILADDSNDETLEILKKWADHPRVKIVHRPTREGYKGGALSCALKATNPMAEFVVVLDADFVPYPDTITQFLKYYKTTVGSLDKETIKISNTAAIQGYQWHVLNKSENWITRGVRAEYAGSYVVERSGEEIYGGLKQIAGSVYMIRRDVLEQIGWATSITEDFELTLKLYEKGYKVIFTPYIQAPSECVSTIKRLIRQRMRWAEGHSHNIKKMFKRLIYSKNLTWAEKFEFIYLSPYYLQSAFFIIGTLSWFLAEVVFQAGLPFWTSTWGWSLVFTNLFALPLVNLVGLFLEESDEKDYLGLASFIALSYVVAPFQGYAAIKGFLAKEEGPWFRTPKTGKITDVFSRGRFYRFVTGIFGAKAQAPKPALQTNLAYNLNHYVSLSTANNTFSQDEEEPARKKPAKWIGRLALAFCLILSILAYDGIKFNDPKDGQGLGLVKTISSKLNQSDVVLTPKKPVFTYNETPNFSLTFDENKLKNKLHPQNILSIFSPKEVSAEENHVKAELLYKGVPAERIEVLIEKQAPGKYQIALNPLGAIKPGKYTLKTAVTQGNNSFKSQQDFRWGVLAMNTEKPLYRPGETIKFGFGVVDDAGNTICVADIKLIIHVPSENKDYQLSTQNGTIKKSGQCGRQSATNTADYLAEFKAKDKEETYQLHLVADTYHGQRSFDGEVKISNNILFDIDRNSYPTRVYPRVQYPVEITIIPSEDFKGEIIENLPPAFQAIEISDKGLLDGKGFIDDFKTPREITWNIDWKKGNTYKLKYRILFPQVSPEFYLMGPLQFKNDSGQLIFEEPKKWQIAVDAVSFVQQAEGSTSNSSVPTQAFTSNPAANNLLIAAWRWNDVTTTVSSVKDTLGNTWTSAVGPITEGTAESAQMFYTINNSAGADTVTFTMSAKTTSRKNVLEYSGTSSTPLDKTSSGTNPSGTSHNTGTAVTTTQNNEELIAFFTFALSVTETAGTNWTIRGFCSSSNQGACVEEQYVTSTGSYQGTITSSGNSTSIGLLATFKDSVVPENPVMLLGLSPLLYFAIKKLKGKKFKHE